jgi:ubiquinone/menaquinone biosynthesis C-methylase UbiE
MAALSQSFAEFERAGWEDPSIVIGYDEHLSVVTRQSNLALLDAAGVHTGSRVLDVATGAGYVAGAAFQCGADVVGTDFSIAQVNLARGRHPAVRVEQADAEALPLSHARLAPSLARSVNVICQIPPSRFVGHIGF